MNTSNSSLERPLVSIIFVNYNGLNDTRKAVLSVLQYSPGSEIIIVDNCSTDGSVESLRVEFPQLTILSLAENKGFGNGCNRGSEKATGKYLFFLNNDALLLDDAPGVLASFLDAHSTVAACGPRLINEDRSFQLSFGPDPSIINEWTTRHKQRALRGGNGKLADSLERRYGKPRVDWISGAAMMIRREIFTTLGGFDELFFMYFEDADLCRRIRNSGFDIVYYSESSIVHLICQSGKKDGGRISSEYRKSQMHYYEKHLSIVSVQLLRIYLILKSFLALFTGTSSSR